MLIQDTVTIANGATASSAFDTRGHRLVGVYVPTVDSGNITFTTAPATNPGATAGTYVAVGNESGTAYSLTAGTGGKFFALPVQFSHARYIKLTSAASQSADRSLTLILEES